MDIPIGNTLWNEYLKFDGNRQVCKRMDGSNPLVRNQCAIRMSVALGRSNCNFNFNNWPRFPLAGHIHRHGNSSACADLPSHVTGSTDLVKYLEDEGLHFDVYTKSSSLTASNIRDSLLEKKGIIYFGRCFTNRDHPERRGSHIDFWNGHRFMNQVLRLSVGGDEPSASDMFSTAEGEIKFSPTP